MNKELISVIIPVYKVERFLDKCIQSIIKQTYTELEIILVDDGSPDASGKICDTYANKDKRIRVIHKENGGLSDARNVGIDKAKGEYITFVDSDDWLPLNAIELLYKALIENKADISSGIITEIKKRNLAFDNSSCKNTILFNNEDALKSMMYLHEFPNSADAKLYKRRLFNNVRYPKGKLYEDLATTYKLFAKSKRIVFVDANVYYYYQNMESIMHYKYTSKRLQGLWFALEEDEFIKKQYPNIREASKYRVFYECVLILKDMSLKSSDKKIVKKYLKEYRIKIKNNNDLYFKQKLLLISSRFGHAIIKIIFKIK